MSDDGHLAKCKYKYCRGTYEHGPYDDGYCAKHSSESNEKKQEDLETDLWASEWTIDRYKLENKKQADRIKTLQADLTQRDNSITEQASTIVELQDELKRIRGVEQSNYELMIKTMRENEALKKANKTYQPRIDELEEGCLEQHKENESLKRRAELWESQSKNIQAEFAKTTKGQLTTEAARLREALTEIKAMTFARLGSRYEIIYEKAEEALNPKEKQ